MSAKKRQMSSEESRDHVDALSQSGMTYPAYATAHADFRFWFDRVLESLDRSPVISAPLAAGLVYAVGLVIALPFGFARIYIGTLAVYLGVVGIALVLAVGHRASERAHTAFETLRPIFMVPDEQYHNFLQIWFGRMTDDRRTLIVAAIHFALFVPVIVVIAFTGSHTLHRLHIQSLHAGGFPHQWFQPRDRVQAVTLLALYAAAIALTMGTAVRLLIVNLAFLFRLRRLPVIPLPTLVRARVRPVTDFYVFVSLMWTSGIVLFAVLFRGGYDAVSLSIMGTLLVMGLLTLAIPQVIFRAYVSHSYQRLCALVLMEWYAQLNVALTERSYPVASLGRLIPDNLADVVQLVERPKMWIYDTQDAVVWLSGQVLAIGLVLAEHTFAAAT
jgi:hypothetical protein